MPPTPAANSAALASFTWLSRRRSPPAKKVDLPDVMITPVTESFSA